MLFAGKTLQQISEADLINLIGVTRENESVDFKEFAYPQPPEDQLPADQRERDRIKNEWKVDLCSDLSALANASGGWIICGMKEQGGLATELCGLGTQVNAEREIARLGQTANSGIEPPIAGLAFQTINLQEETKSKVILIHVPRSFRAPHRVKATRKFHVRRSGRNDEMNIDELRIAFNFSESIVEQIKEFRSSRIDVLITDGHEDVPVRLANGALLVLHLVPLTMANPGARVTFQSFEFASQAFGVDGNWSYANYARYNLDGVLVPDRSDAQGETEWYYQVFRNGACEYVETLDYSDKMLPLGTLEAYVKQALKYLMLFQKNLGVELPSVVMLTFVGVKGYGLKPAIKGLWGSAAEPSTDVITKKNLVLPDVVLDDFTSDPAVILKPVFDVLWNAGGWTGSLNYDENGSFIERK